jgi:hypothetical protein
MSNKQQTAVEWLRIVINKRGPKENNLPEWLQELYAKAKKMEKEQMENLWDAAISHGGCKCYDEIMTFEEYYNETFKQ